MMKIPWTKKGKLLLLVARLKKINLLLIDLMLKNLIKFTLRGKWPIRTSGCSSSCLQTRPPNNFQLKPDRIPFSLSPRHSPTDFRKSYMLGGHPMSFPHVTLILFWVWKHASLAQAYCQLPNCHIPTCHEYLMSQGQQPHTFVSASLSINLIAEISTNEIKVFL